MIYLECREANRAHFDAKSLTFRRDVIEARHPWGAQDESCFTLQGISSDQKWVYICGDKLRTYNTGDSVYITPESLSTMTPGNESSVAIAVCGSFTDPLNCYQIDGSEYKPISCNKFVNFFCSFIENVVSISSSTTLKINLLMPYGARIHMLSLPPDSDQNHAYAKILDKPNVLEKGIFTSFAYRFCSELRARKPTIRFDLYAAIGDFRPILGTLHWETEHGFSSRFSNYKTGTEFTDYNTCNSVDFPSPSYYGTNEGALIHYDCSDLNSIAIYGESTAPLYYGDMHPPYSAGDIPSAPFPSLDGVIAAAEDLSGLKEHDEYLKK